MDTNRTSSELETQRCAICGSSTFKVLYTKYDLKIVKCRRCHLVYTNPRLKEDDILKRYDRDYFYNEYLPGLSATENASDSEPIKRHYSLFVDLASKYYTPGQKLLDVGCGAGFFLKSAEEFGWKVEGAELLEAAAEYAKKVLGVTVHTGSLEDLHFPDESFSVVTLLDTMEHLLDPKQSLGEIRRILKNHGVCIISTPDFNSISRFLFGKNWAVLSPAEHLFYFTEKTLRDLLKAAGFQTLGIRNLLHFNPEYTHNTHSRRSHFWANRYERLKKERVLERIRQFEYLDTMSIPGDRDVILPGWQFSNIKSKIYTALRHCLKGDTLVAVARKENHGPKEACTSAD